MPCHDMTCHGETRRFDGVKFSFKLRKLRLGTFLLATLTLVSLRVAEDSLEERSRLDHNRSDRISFRSISHRRFYRSRGAYPRFGARPDLPFPKAKVKSSMSGNARSLLRTGYQRSIRRSLFANWAHLANCRSLECLLAQMSDSRRIDGQEKGAAPVWAAPFY